MKNLIIAVAVLAIFAAMASARGPQEIDRVVPYDGSPSRGIQVWYDDIETGAPGWTTGDDSAQAIMWHTDDYMAYSGDSWWCGTFAYDADGGYGNLWDQRLDSPYIAWAGYTYPVLTFMFRNDSEYLYDYSYVLAESSGSFVPLNRGYTGTMAWGGAGFYLGNKDEPAKIRFQFISDGGYSDADGDYLSVGGGFAIDDVVVMDYNTSTIFFEDNAEAKAINLIPSVPAAAGNFWTIQSSVCRAYSDPHYWGCTSPDSTAVPANLNNWLMTPIIDISGYECVQGCTLYFVQQMFMSGAYGGSWQEWGTPDAGATWTRTGWWFGHQCQFGTPAGPCAHYLSPIPIIWPGGPTGTAVAGKFVMLTDAFGNGCDQETCTLGYCSSGMNVDDTWIEVTECPPNPVEESSWGKIKSMYK